MMPGEAERKLKKAEQELEEVTRERDAYKEFFEASLQMNISAAALPAAKRTHDAMRALEVLRIRKGIPEKSALEALNALKNIS